ncbi:hypothetical protein CPB97_007912 [Podila verticillata]|nr:hypothetical protein CPB97_007912 [Podila verticillata]
MTQTMASHLDIRGASLGSLRMFPDDLIVRAIFSLLGPKDLRSLSMVSRYVHVFSRNEFLWKLICIDRRDHISMRLPFRGTWLLTYLFPRPEDHEACAKHPLAHPIQLQGITSDYLHMQWTRSNMFFGHFYPPPPMPPTPAIGNNRPVNTTVPFEDYQLLDKETFYRRYGFPNRPVMLYNSGVEAWPAWKQWTLEALLEKYGDAPFRVSNLDGEEEPYFPVYFRDFYQYVKYNKDEDPLYLFDPLFADWHEELSADYQVPKYFETDFFALLEGKDRPPYRWMLIGPQRTGASWHTDPSGTSAWNTLLSGHKRWALYPPHIVPPGHDPESPKWLSSVEWYLDVYPFLAPEARPIEVVQNPGQTIYVPTGWWHMVLNMDDTVAVTQNFADETNILQVKDSMLSEVEDKRQDARWIALVEELSKVRPDLIPALTFDPRSELSILLDAEESLLDEASLESTATWKNRAIEVVARVTGVKHKPEDITPIKTGQNVDKFVKFFTPLNDGLACFHAEVKANASLAQSEAKTRKLKKSTLSSPKMVASGFLLDEETSTKWRWPYVLMEALHIFPDENDIDFDLNPLVESGDYMPDNSEDYGTLLRPILKTLHRYHSSPLIHQGEHPTKDPLDHFQECLSNVTKNHAQWRVFPRHLLEQLPDYLPKSARQVFDPSRGDAIAPLVHGDVNPSNVLGHLHYQAHVDEAMSYPGVLSVPPPPTFEPTAVIDFGDAQFSSDPLVDFVSVYVTILNCRKDLTDMVELLRESWQASFDAINPERLAQRCMWHVLLWPSEGLGMHLVRCVPEIGEMASWQQVEEAIFGWWKVSK